MPESIESRFVSQIKNVTSASLKSSVDKLHNDKLEQVPNDLSSLKSKVDESDISKLKATPVDLSKLKGVVYNNVVKETKYDELVKKN